MKRINPLLAVFSVILFGVCAITPLASKASTTAVLLPNSDGNYLQWTPSTGTTHYTLVDESTCNGTTDYNSTVTTVNRDSYGVDLSSVGDGAVISQIDIVPCASRNNNGNGSTLDVFYRFNGANSSDSGSYTLSGTTPTELATTTIVASPNLLKTSTSTLEIGAVFTAGNKGARLSRIATVLTYTLTTPSAPTNLIATTMSSSRNDLAWTDNSSNELGFKVYRAQNNGSFAQVATTTQNAISYSDTGLAPEQSYAYYVAAYNSVGEANSNTATSTLGIAFDNATSAEGVGVTTSLTFSHTVTSAADRILFVGVRVSGAGLVSSVTFGGSTTTMTLVDSIEMTNGQSTAFLYYLVNPPSGTQDVVVTLSSANYLSGTAVSYTGVAQSNPIDVQRTYAGQVGTGEAYTQSVSTTVAFDWTLMMGVCDGSGTPAPASGSTQRGSHFQSAGLLLDSDGPINPPSLASLGFYDYDLTNPHFASVMVGFKRN